MSLSQWVNSFAALGCSSVLIDALFRYRPMQVPDGRYAWVEAEPHEEGVTEHPHRILIRPTCAQPFLVIWHPDDLFLQTMRRSRFALRSIDPPSCVREAGAILDTLVHQLQRRPLHLVG